MRSITRRVALMVCVACVAYMANVTFDWGVFRQGDTKVTYIAASDASFDNVFATTWVNGAPLREDVPETPARTEIVHTIPKYPLGMYFYSLNVTPRQGAGVTTCAVYKDTELIVTERQTNEHSALGCLGFSF